MTRTMQSIRWRLVASYVLSSAVTVGVAGILAQSLVGRAVAERRTEDLAANAVAFAGRIGPVVDDRALPHPPMLVELARSAAFVADARVRVLDAQENVVVDSGEPEAAMAMMIVADPAAGTTWTHGLPGDGAFVVRRLDGGLGPRRLTFGASEADDGALLGLDEALVDVDGVALGEAGRAVAGDADGPVLVWRSRDVIAPSTDGAVDDALVGHVITKERHVVALHGPVRSAPAMPIRVPIGDPDAPSGFVEMSASDSATAQALATTRHAFTLAALAASLVATALGLVVGRSMTQPLQNLTETAKRMAGDDLTARADVTSGDEIGQLATQFNTMADRLGESFQALAEERDALRRFIADASHELRTPITALRSFVELLDGPAAEDAAVRAEFLGESQAQLERLEWLTGQLLDLSRLDAGLAGIAHESVAVDDLIQAALAPLRPRAAAEGVTLVDDALAAGLEVRGDRARLETALANLVANAVKFGRRGTTVRVGAERADDKGGPWVRIWVADDGPGIAPEDLPFVFERFYRGQAIADDPGGSGLGLAIVRSIARAHGGSIAVESAPGAGSRFTLELPA